ncbi:MAG: glycoside hydrolase family 13 protein [Bacteroidales bacterium]|nr:glycoside hydrolase family 13 protein [Bacteroidales bacterium]
MTKHTYRSHFLLLIMIFFMGGRLLSQTLSIERVSPPFWWAGMKNSHLQLLLKGNDWTGVDVTLNSDEAHITRVSFAENPKYLFIDVDLKEHIRPGILEFVFRKNRQTLSYNYEIRMRDHSELRHKGFNSGDLIYLILPDRFSNGDSSNDIISGMNESSSNRDSIFSRHGGDLQGIINKLDYLEDLGITAIWLNPVYENNQNFASYHGYAPSDHYRVDPRLGTNEKYRELVRECHERGIKVIKDLVFNHIGNQHWFYKDLPFENWINKHDTFTFSNFRVTTLLDPYASDSDLERMRRGWFDRHMPDLNCSDPFLAQYFIQNSIWWIEYAGLNGFRFDTYAYSDLNFLSALAERIFEEYPEFNTVGEIWDNGVAIQAYFSENNCNNRLLNTHLKGITDFQLYHAINNTLNEGYGWNKGVERIYYTLSSDFVYESPFNNLIFLDNHDLSRFFSVAGKDIRKFKMGIGFLLTTRGIPLLYYGTEILMSNFKGPDEMVREDFPGGWIEDSISKFVPEGRTDLENEAFNFVKTLACKRKNSSALKNGRLVQFVPQDGVYVFFRISNNEKIMVVMNASDDIKNLSTERFSEILEGTQNATDFIDGSPIQLNSLTLKPWEIIIAEIE